MYVSQEVQSAVLDGIKWASGAAGLVVSLPLAKLVVGLSKEWAVRGVVQERTASAAEQLTHQTATIIARLDKAEYILTGDEGVNGLRGDVRRVSEAVSQLGVRMELTDARVSDIEQRVERRIEVRRNVDRDAG